MPPRWGHPADSAFPVAEGGTKVVPQHRFTPVQGLPEARLPPGQTRDPKPLQGGHLGRNTSMSYKNMRSGVEKSLFKCVSPLHTQAGSEGGGVKYTRFVRRRAAGISCRLAEISVQGHPLLTCPQGAGAHRHWMTPLPPAYTKKGRACWLYSADHGFPHEYQGRPGGDPGQPTHQEAAMEELGWTRVSQSLNRAFCPHTLSRLGNHWSFKRRRDQEHARTPRGNLGGRHSPLLSRVRLQRPHIGFPWPRLLLQAESGVVSTSVPRAGAGAALLYCHLEQRYQKRGGNASPRLRETTAPWKRNHNPVLWWGRETSKHAWCLGCGMRGTWQEVSPLQGPRCRITRWCSAAQALTDPRGQQQPSEVTLPAGPSGCPCTQPQAILRTLLLSYPHPCQPPEWCLSPGDTVVTDHCCTPPLPGILSSSRKTTTRCLSWASSPSQVGQWCSVNVAEHGMKSVLSPGRLSCQQAKETLAQAGFPLQNYSQDKMCDSCHIVS